MYCKFRYCVYLYATQPSALKSFAHILFAVQLLGEMLSFPTLSPLLEIAAPTGEQASWDTYSYPNHVSEESEGFTLKLLTKVPLI